MHLFDGVRCLLYSLVFLTLVYNLAFLGVYFDIFYFGSETFSNLYKRNLKFWDLCGII